MRTIAIMGIATLMLMPSQAAEDPLAALAGEVEAWAVDNLDEDLLATIGRFDSERTQRVYEDTMRALAGTNVYELAHLKSAANEVLTLLKKFEETAPYAAWLESHLDYFTVSEELKKTAKAAPPTFDTQTKVWQQQFRTRAQPTRAEQHLPPLKAIFNAAGLPPALVWLAEVESSFDARARSPVGAAGMFQLMPGTAKALGLSLSPMDERLDAQKSARAAARYLRYLHDRFRNWQLALAAYNAGEGRVKQLLDAAKTQTYSAIASRLPAETQLYVPKVDAVLWKREGLRLATLPVPK